MLRADVFRLENAVLHSRLGLWIAEEVFKGNPHGGALDFGVEGMQPCQYLFLELRLVHQAFERRSGIQHLRVVRGPRFLFEHRPQSALNIRLLFPDRVFRQRREQRKHNRLAVRVPLLQDLNHLAHQFWIGRRCIEVQDSALTALVDVADSLAHLGASSPAKDSRQRG